ncbi:hypothetical protein [Kitasatospora sp. NPDC088134]|uniref:hypothetical protein n=1 Tax=Kitasatospora sp. NPDC088134 TaxID=3364071 RepID=UPI0038079EF8
MRTRAIAGWSSVAAALLVAAVSAWGQYETRSGGRSLLADRLGHPWLLGLAALALVFLAGVLLGDAVARRFSAGGLLLALVLCGLAVPGTFFGGNPHTEVVRTAAPGGADRVLTVVHRGPPSTETEVQEWVVQVESGSGWAGRRWTLLDADGVWPGAGAFTSARWTGPDRLAVVTDTEVKVYDFSGGAPVLVPA